LSKLPISANKSTSIARQSPLQLYLREIAKYPLLTPEEEYEAAVKHYEDDDVTQAHRLVTANLRLVVKIANEFNQAQANLLDLIQEGNHGLMKAVKKFNPYKGVRLSSYASWWIKAYILKFIMENKSHVKIGTTQAQRKLFYNLKKETEKLIQQYDHADVKLLASNLNVRESDVIEMQQRLSAPDHFLDAPISDGEGASDKYSDILIVDQEPVDEQIADRELTNILKEDIADFKKTLEQRDLELFESRIYSENPETLKAFGDRHGISRERARQIEARIIKKLKEFIENRGTIIDAN
jgi:RNA polymerase sigma-32 factor